MREGARRLAFASTKAASCTKVARQHEDSLLRARKQQSCTKVAGQHEDSLCEYGCRLFLNTKGHPRGQPFFCFLPPFRLSCCASLLSTLIAKRSTLIFPSCCVSNLRAACCLRGGSPPFVQRSCFRLRQQFRVASATFVQLVAFVHLCCLLNLPLQGNSQ